VTEIMMMTKR